MLGILTALAAALTSAFVAVEYGVWWGVAAGTGSFLFGVVLAALVMSVVEVAKAHREAKEIVEKFEKTRATRDDVR
jgi:hypothetical protein